VTYKLREVNEEFTFIYPKHFNFLLRKNDFECGVKRLKYSKEISKKKGLLNTSINLVFMYVMLLPMDLGIELLGSVNCLYLYIDLCC